MPAHALYRQVQGLPAGGAMKWLAESLQDGRSGRYSVKRLVTLIAALALALALIILAGGAYRGREVDMAIGLVAGALAGLGGYTYVGGKSVEAKRPKEEASE